MSLGNYFCEKHPLNPECLGEAVGVLLEVGFNEFNLREEFFSSVRAGRSDRAILMLKPDALTMDIDGTPLLDLIEQGLNASDLIVVERASHQLTEEEVHRIYPILDIPDPVFGEGWKTRMVHHLMSQPVVSLLIEGVDVNKRLNSMKYGLRRMLCDLSGEKGLVIENIAHVPDEEEFDVSREILFAG